MSSTVHRMTCKKMSKSTTYLQPLVEDDLLPLESNVLGPLDESSKVGLGGEVTSCIEKSEVEDWSVREG